MRAAIALCSGGCFGIQVMHKARYAVGAIRKHTSTTNDSPPCNLRTKTLKALSITWKSRYTTTDGDEVAEAYLVEDLEDLVKMTRSFPRLQNRSYRAARFRIL